MVRLEKNTVTSQNSRSLTDNPVGIIKPQSRFCKMSKSFSTATGDGRNRYRGDNFSRHRKGDQLIKDLSFYPSLKLQPIYRESGEVTTLITTTLILGKPQPWNVSQLRNFGQF
jgi:hypothetical protein